MKRLGFVFLALLLSSCGGGTSTPGGGGGNQTNPPSAPAGITATAGDRQVNLSWNASSGATGYHVKRSTTSGGPYTQRAAPTETSYNDTSLTNGTAYFYVVTAVNSNGESANSSQVSATPTSPVSIPAAPTGLAATAGNAQVNLSWNASSGATSYHVKRSTTGGGPYTQVAAPASTSYSDTSVTNGTPYFYVVSALNTVGESANSAQASATPVASAADVTITIDPTKTKPISPWIYGINSYSPGSDPPLLTLDRMGGNRWTAYNWENNASNAGSDWGPYSNDSFLGGGNTPAEAVRSVVASDQSNGLASLMTIQLQGYVSADKNGLVDVSQPLATRLAARFKQVIDKKGSTFTTSPSTTDASVYMDEFLWAMDQKLPGIFGASPTLPTFVSLDNEPELWNSTHLEVQGPNPISSDDYITKTINLTKALKDQFPNVVIFGPVHYGFLGAYNWQVESFSNGDWFTDKYLRAMKTASDSYGKRLLDVYDFHWYAEVYDSGGTRIISMDGTTLTDEQVQLIVQSPRSLWDSTYNDGNWIAHGILGAPIYILGRLQAKIDADYPGTKIAITEYENGGWNHIAGTIAQADNLGVFGSQGVFAATFWPPGGTYSYALAGFRMFRGFDGANACFGDISVQATSSNVENVVVYASTDSTTPGRVVFVAINRSTSSKVTAINGLPLSGTAYIYRITAASAQGKNPVVPVFVGQMPASGSSLTITLPALSVSTIEVR